MRRAFVITFASVCGACSNNDHIPLNPPANCPNDDCGYYPPYDTAPPACPWPDLPAGGCGWSSIGVGPEPEANVCTYRTPEVCGDASTVRTCHCEDVADGGAEWRCTSSAPSTCDCVDAGSGEASSDADTAPESDADADASLHCPVQDTCPGGGFFTCTQCLEFCCRDADVACFGDPTCRAGAECISSCRESCAAGSEQHACIEACRASASSPLLDAFVCCSRASCTPICPT